MVPSLILLATLAAAPAPQSAPETTAAAPSAPSGSVETGLALLKRGRFRSARAELDKAVTADPQNAAAQFYLGYALYKISEPSRRLTREKEEAAQHFAAAYSIDPGFRPAMGKQ